MRDSESCYPVVDLFAGPGGLGEGFAELHNEDGSPAFKSVASIESDTYAHQTLLLRHFFRSFRLEEVPDKYYDYLARRISKEELINKNKKHWSKVQNNALQIPLGKENHDSVKNLLRKRLHGMKKWALIGGPPCQAYSIVGRSRMMGNPKFEKDKRHFLYKEYLKILIDHKPPVFIMENVKGLLSAKINGQTMINKIFKDLSSPIKAIKANKNGLNYKLFSLVHPQKINGDFDPGSFIVEAENYGVPQARHRMFILGIRADLDIHPPSLKKKKPPTLEQIIGTMPKIRSGISQQKDSVEQWKNILTASDISTWMQANDRNQIRNKENKNLQPENH